MEWHQGCPLHIFCQTPPSQNVGAPLPTFAPPAHSLIGYIERIDMNRSFAIVALDRAFAQRGTFKSGFVGGVLQDRPPLVSVRKVCVLLHGLDCQWGPGLCYAAWMGLWFAGWVGSLFNIATVQQKRDSTSHHHVLFQSLSKHKQNYTFR